MFTTLQRNTKIFIIVMYIVISLVLGLIIAVVFSMLAPKPTKAENISLPENSSDRLVIESQSQKTPTAPIKSNTTTEKKIPTKESETEQSQDEGIMTYKVGTDIKSGIYKLKSNSQQAYYKIANSNSEQDIDKVHDMVFFNFAYIYVKSGQYLKLTDCILEDNANMKPYKPENGKYVSGQYKVGYDIKAGNYTFRPVGDIGYVEISATPSKDTVEFSEYVENNTKITIKNGQYLTLSNVDIID